MDGYYDTRLLSRLKRSYDDRRNTLAWAMVVWVVTAVAFAFFLPIEPTILRSIGVTVGWSAIHIVRRI